MRVIRLMLTWAIAGALLCALVMLCYRLYIFDRAGQLQGIPLGSLLTDPGVLFDAMRLHTYALMGAVGGAIVGLLWALLTGLIRILVARRNAPAPSMSRADPDDVIRNLRTQRADAYLAKRQAERQSSNSS